MEIQTSVIRKEKIQTDIQAIIKVAISESVIGQLN